MENIFSGKMRHLTGRPESGSWLHTTLADPTTGAVELIELRAHGGRLNPPGSFPVT